jgi:hypothetical protein
VTAGGRDWQAWHRRYDDDAPLQRRLATVQARLRDALEGAPPGPIPVVSMCAGDGRDLLGALDGHPRARDVRARLVELDPVLAAAARARAETLGLTGVEVVVTDAGTTDAYAGAVPARIVMACGIFGNVADDHIATTVSHLPSLCAPGATAVWTRHRRPPDRTPWIRSCFRAAGFHELAFDAPADAFYGVGTARYDGPPVAYRPGVQLFRFEASV